MLPDPREIEARVSAWQRAVVDTNVEATAALYSPDAILMGIGETAIRLGRREIMAHYTALFDGKLRTVVDQTTIEGSCGTALVTGLGRVARVDGAAEMRFRMMFAFGGDAWLLIHHHMEIDHEGFVPTVTTADLSPNTIATGSTNPPPTAAAMQNLRASATAAAIDAAVPLPPLYLPTDAPTSLRPVVNDGRVADEVPVIVPRMTIEIGRFPDIAPPTVALVVVGPAPVVTVPDLQIAVGDFPRIKTEQTTRVVSAPDAPRASTAVNDLRDDRASPVRPLAVASFAQRAPQPTKPAVAPTDPKAAPKLATSNAAPKSAPRLSSAQIAAKEKAASDADQYPSYRAGHWTQDGPVFGNRVP